MTIHVLAFAGSLREASYNRGLLRAAQELAPAGITIEIFDLDGIPMFNADVEAQGTPAPVMAFRERLKAADAYLIATPEYNWSIPGVLKNAIDWASRKGPDFQAPINDKPVAIMGAGGMLGTVRAQMHLREILQHNNLYVLNRPAVMVARAGQFFVDGELVDEELRDRIRRQLEALRDWAIQLNPTLAERDAQPTAVALNGN